MRELNSLWDDETEQLWKRLYRLELEAEEAPEGERRDAIREEARNLRADLQTGRQGMATMIKTDPRFWDCECPSPGEPEGRPYIHAKTCGACAWCGAEPDEQPDARPNEITVRPNLAPCALDGGDCIGPHCPICGDPTSPGVTACSSCLDRCDL